MKDDVITVLHEMRVYFGNLALMFEHLNLFMDHENVKQTNHFFKYDVIKIYSVSIKIQVI